jgi:glycosyltransferase involved in cell wall biosynthesis
MTKLAYLTSEYPARSHTFIRREIYELRKRGLRIDVMAIRRPRKSSLLCEQDWEDYNDTWQLLPLTTKRLIRTHILALATKPALYSTTFFYSIKNRLPGMKNFLWSLFHFAEAIVVADELEKRKIKHLHIHFANASATIGYLISIFTNISFSMTLHGASDFGYPSVVLLGQKLEKCRFSVCVSYFGLAQAYRTLSPKNWNKIFVSRCGIEINALPENAHKKNNKILKIISVGRLSSEKGQIGLIKAFSLVSKRINDIELILVGDGPEKFLIEKYITKYKIENRVTLTGSVSEEEVFNLINKADIFVLSSLMEGIPLVLMESMALSVPVIAPRIAGIPELVNDGVDGLLYSPADWSELAEKIILLTNDKQLAKTIGANGKNKVMKNFTIEKCVEPLFHQLNKI